jgi:hypothetical protein
MNAKSDFLFCENKLSYILEDNLKMVQEKVNEVDEKQFMHLNDNEIEEYVFSKLEILPLEIYEDRKEMEKQEVQVDVRNVRDGTVRAIYDMSRPALLPGLRISVFIPFKGDFNLWRVRPGSIPEYYPQAKIHYQGQDSLSGSIEIIMERPADTLDDGSYFKQRLEDELRKIRPIIQNIRKEVEVYNKKLLNQINHFVKIRRQHLNKHDEVLKSLNIPLKRNAGAPDVSNLPIRRKIVNPLPTVPGSPPEPRIDDEGYEYILKILRHEGRSFENTPATFAIHDEEELRDIILAHLNTHYKGQATGETFRKSGKTDIRIEDKNRSAFVAECKIWRGKSELSKALEQLLGYLTWRDCKASLIIFNKKIAKFSELLSKVPESLKEHPNFISPQNVDEDGEWRFLFKTIEDEYRRITIHVFLFNLYVNNRKKQSGQSGVKP